MSWPRSNNIKVGYSSAAMSQCCNSTTVQPRLDSATVQPHLESVGVQPRLRNAAVQPRLGISR